MNYWEWYLKPIQMTDELYYVGTTKGPSHLLKTSDGLVLIDTGFPQSIYMLTDNIRALGFDLHDIKHIVHSHGHIDHFGATRALVEMTGAKTYIGFGDQKAVMGEDGLDSAEDIGFPLQEPFTPDVILHDGDKVKFGETEITFLATPGHTKGTMSLFFTVHDGGVPYLAGMFGGAGLNTLKHEYLDRHGLSDECRAQYLASVEKLLPIPVEVHLGNHLANNNQKERMKHIGEGKNPFIDATSWPTFLKEKREEVLALIASDKNEKKVR